MGAKPTPGIGFGIGIERALIVCETEGVAAGPSPSIDVFVIDTVGGLASLPLLAELRAAGFSADRAYGNRSMKKQWGAADRVGARWGVMLAPRESADGKVVVKNLVSGDQEPVKRDEVAAWLRTKEDRASR
jgi:histidyl-tRNA synthetase